MAEPILEIDRLGISFFTRAGEIPAVMDFSCKVMPGEAMGLVGEFGLRQVDRRARDHARPARRRADHRRLDPVRGPRHGEPLATPELRAIRGSKIAMVYQEPMASLNPTMLIGRQLMEVPLIHDQVSKDEARAPRLDMVKAVRLPDPERVMRAYPHQLSGGQQQRVVIAMALLSNPRLLILDEPTTALDVTVEAGIVALVKDLTARTGASSLFISHNLGLILETCDEVTVMYSGEAVETGAVSDVFGAVRHPYTQGLFRSMPMPGTNKNDNPLVPIPGQLPLPHERPKGCNFGPRCALFRRGSVRSAPTCRCSRSRARAAIKAAASGSRRSTGPRSARPAARLEPVAIGPTVLDVERLKKHYRVAASALFGRRREPRGQGGRGHLVRRSRGGGAGDRRRIRAAASRRSPRCCSGSRRRARASSSSIDEAIQNQPVESRAVKTIASIQMIFQNPFDTLNPSYSVGSQIVRTLERFRDRRQQRRAARHDAAPARSREAAARLRRRARRGNCRAARSSASASRAPSPGGRASSSPTSRCRRSTFRCRRRSANS